MHWDRSKFSVGVNDMGLVILLAYNASDPDTKIMFELDHEIAAKLGEALLVKAAYVEYQIAETVDRMTKLE